MIDEKKGTSKFSRVCSLLFVPAVAVLVIHLLRVAPGWAGYIGYSSGSVNAFLLLAIPFGITLFTGWRAVVEWSEIKKEFHGDLVGMTGLLIFCSVGIEGLVIAILALASGDFTRWFQPWGLALILVFILAVTIIVVGLLQKSARQPIRRGSGR